MEGYPPGDLDAMKPYRAIQEFLDRTGDWVTAHSYLAAGFLSVVYWLLAAGRAAYKLLWNDELVTWHIARLPTWSAMWRALVTGSDQELPFIHVAVRLSHYLFGAGPLATRLPALFAFWVFLVCLFFLLKPHVSPVFALIGMILPMLTFAWRYAFEARAYALLLAAATFALLCWDSATDRHWRPLALVGIAVGLAAALLSHYMGVLLAIPFAAGEIVRSIQRRRIDFPVWLAFLAATPVVVIYPRLIAATHDWDFASMHPSLGEIPQHYDTLLRAAIAPLLIAGLAGYLVGRETKPAGIAGLLPRHLATAFLGLLVAPAIFIVVARILNQFYFTTRYALPAIIGAAALLVVLGFSACRGSRRSGAAALLVLTAWLVFARGAEAVRFANESNLGVPGKFPLLGQALRTDLPIVIADPLTYFQADFYLPAQDVGRIYFVLDRPAALKYNQDVIYQLCRLLPVNFPIRGKVEQYSDFARANTHFLLHVDPELPSLWVYDIIMNSGGRITLRSATEDESLFEVVFR